MINATATRPRDRSAEALRSLSEGRKQDDRAAILCALIGSKGKNDERIAEDAGVRLNSAPPRRKELVDAGLVEDSGRTMLTTTGRFATAWRLTDAGREALRKLAGL